MYISEWENFYRRYRVLLQEWRCPGAPPGIEQQAFRTLVTSRKPPEWCTKQLRRWGYRGPSLRQLNEALQLRKAIHDSPPGWSPEEAFEDVYQAALRMETYMTWQGDQNKLRLYRGQRNHTWPVVPKIFRGSAKNPVRAAAIETNLKSTLEKICTYVRHLQQQHPGLTEEKGVAIVQHYSTEIGVGTWLIDFSWDAFIALFFASDHGQTNDVGRIQYLAIPEWERLSAGGTNRLGRIRVIDAQGVPRIDAQHALFLDTSHPDLFEQIVPHSLFFKQVSGLVFEDKTRQPPVERGILYPDRDEWKDDLLTVELLPPDKPLAYQPASDASVGLGAEDYLSLVESWFRNDGVEIDSRICPILQQVCAVYAAMQTEKAKQIIDIYGRGLHGLYDAVLYDAGEGVKARELLTIHDSLKWLIERPMESDATELISQLILDVGAGALDQH